MNQEVAPPECPAGLVSCDIIAELTSLRKTVNQLSDLVHTDTLTGLSNYRCFRMVLDQEMERTRRTGQPTCLIMLDLDFFKKVNDEWGHDVGNQALVSVAKQMTSVVRKMDAPCRYGGEEFAIILPATHLIDAVKIAERLRVAIEETPLRLSDGELCLTASLGVDVFSPGESGCPEDMVKRADQYLYQAKKRGRNQVCHPEIRKRAEDSSIDADEKDALFGLFGGA